MIGDWAMGDFLAYHAKVRPERVACMVLTTGETVDFQGLDRLVGQTAAWLAERFGAGSGARVATLVRNGLEFLLLHYGCDRAGLVFVPLNWRLSAHELAGLIADCTPSLLLTDPEFAPMAREAAAESGLEILLVDAFRAAIAAADPIALPRPDERSPWTLLYTSGTTGRPKGVIITRAGALAGSLNLSFIAGIGADFVMLCDPPMFHTVALFGISRTALLVGATILISDRFHPTSTLNCLADPALGVTHYFGVPQIGLMLMQEPGFADADLSRLKAVLMGGAPLPPVVVEGFGAKGVVVINGFGMTETCSVMHMPVNLQAVLARPNSVGAPTPFIEARIVDEAAAEVADGEVGELWLKGPAITPGYWNQPEATAATFQDGWFKTGDAARREDGFYELVDRRKDMYISGGENVYPAEVEAVIAALAGVAEVGVASGPSERWGECGHAFVVRGRGSTLTSDDVLAHCATRLAKYKQPAVVHFVDALPRNSAGKIRKDELRRLAAASR